MLEKKIFQRVQVRSPFPIYLNLLFPLVMSMTILEMYRIRRCMNDCSSFLNCKWNYQRNLDPNMDLIIPLFIVIIIIGMLYSIAENAVDKDWRTSILFSSMAISFFYLYVEPYHNHWIGQFKQKDRQLYSLFEGWILLGDFFLWV